MSTLERLKKLFSDTLDLRQDAIASEVTLDDLGLDSLDKIEFMFAIEDEFKIKVSERDLKINTVQDLIDIIDRLVAEQQNKG